MEHDYAYKVAEVNVLGENVDEGNATIDTAPDDDDEQEEIVLVDENDDEEEEEEELELEAGEMVPAEEAIREEELHIDVDDDDEDNATPVLAVEPMQSPLDQCILTDRTTDVVNHVQDGFEVKDHKCYTIRIMSDNKEVHQCVHECDICGKRFRNKRCAKLCKKTAKDPYSKYYLCEICGKVFTYISSFIAHHNFKHSEQKLFLKQQRLMECTVCLKKFSTKWNLKTHMQSHMNVFPYLCEFCGKKFKKSDIFKIHLRIHTGIKPYGCPQCDKRFATKGMMTTHLRSHTGEKPYSCEFCDKSYAGLTALRIHRRMHTGERPFRCHLCPTERTFSTKKALRFHLKQPVHD